MDFLRDEVVLHDGRRAPGALVVHVLFVAVAARLLIRQSAVQPLRRPLPYPPAFTVSYAHVLPIEEGEKFIESFLVAIGPGTVQVGEG
jgi:hypothetical protein